MAKHTTELHPIRVLMVCLGNICRSPTAHGVLHHLIRARGLAGQVEVESCGTADYHIGEAPDLRTLRVARARGYDFSNQRARQLNKTDFEKFDYILAMDRANLETLQRRCPEHFQHKLALFLSYSGRGTGEVPDPYYEDMACFEQVLDLVEEAADKLLKHIINTHLRDGP